MIHGLNRHYYSIAIDYRKNELEQKMLLNLHKEAWESGLTLEDYCKHSESNERTVAEMLKLAKSYNKVRLPFCLGMELIEDLTKVGENACVSLFKMSHSFPFLVQSIVRRRGNDADERAAGNSSHWQARPQAPLAREGASAGKHG